MAFNITRRGLLPLLAAGFARPQGSRPPNILVLMSDQHNPRVTGCYGDKVARTPNLDGLAKRGVLFENAYCQAPVCVPSRMSFLSGRQPSENRVWSNGDTLPSDVTTFAHALGASGYETALIGRMHFNGVDQWHGFEKRLVGALSPQFPYIGYPLTKELFPGATNSSKASVTIAGPGKTAYQAFDEDVTKGTVQFLRDRKAGDRPFCAVSGFVLPHSPFVCTKEDWDYYYDRVSIPKYPAGYFDRLHPALKTWRQRRGVEDLTDEEIRRARAAYYGLVTEFDRHVGRILGALREAGLEENTIVVYTTDHGEKAGENGLWWKFNFYDGSVSVPLIISYPAGVKGGQRVREIASMVDIGPTLCDFSGGEKMPMATGRSLRPLLEGRTAGWPNEAFSELPPAAGVPATRMIRSGRWKLIHYDGMRPQLFDLEADPQEFNDLGESQAHAEVRARLQARVLEGWSARVIEAELAQRAKHNELIRKWSMKVKPDAPQQWKAPPGSNVLPSLR
jgi:choline-sulfatase